MLLEEMSWAAAKEKFAEGGLVIIPTGSCEQHGAHMPLGTDTYAAFGIAKEMGERLNCLVAPAVNYGNCSWHYDFPGTIGLDEELLFQLYWSIAEQLVRWGATHLMFINGHGGNTNPIARVGLKMREEYNVPCAGVDWWDICEALKPGWIDKRHGGVLETAAVLYFHPDLVHMEYAPEPAYKEIVPGLEVKGRAVLAHEGVSVATYLRMADVTDSGVEGKNPKQATAEMGETGVKMLCDFLEGFAEKFLQIKLNDCHKSHK